MKKGILKVLVLIAVFCSGILGFGQLTNHTNQDLTTEQLARTYGTSTGWFIKEFSKYTGCTPKKYINEVRLNHAKELLSSTNYNISKISTVCGFENPLYFSRYFQKNYHMAPTKYRNTLKIIQN